MPKITPPKERPRTAKDNGWMHPEDLQILVFADDHVSKAYDYHGKLRWSIRSRCDGVGDPGDSGRTDLPNSDTPKGIYKMGTRYVQEPGTDLFGPYGPVCYDLISMQGQEEKAQRAGISAHGGRDKTPDQRPSHWAELAMTHGCIRWDDDDIIWTVDPSVTYIREKRRGAVWVVVI
jgi:hypothetical protein